MVIRFLLSAVLLLPGLVTGSESPQDSVPEFTLDQAITVTTSRIPVPLPELSQSITVFDRKDIESTPAMNIQDLLGFATGIEIREQGPAGVQGHAHVRGAGYEQTLILVDGAKVNDPQTGHHNLHLPVDMDQIEKIEILKGAASRVYGPNAFSGAINIITKQDYSRAFRVKASYGEDQTHRESADFAGGSKQLHHSLAFSRQASEGYRQNTDYRILNGSYGMNGSTGKSSYSLYGGFSDKEFGANQFYSSPSEWQWEKTRTSFVRSGYAYNARNTFFSGQVYWRQNRDHYIWDKRNPAVYENVHTTDMMTAEAQVVQETSLGTTAIGAEASGERIKSGNLGDHNRDRLGIFAEQKFSLMQAFTFRTGASASYYSNWGWNLSPGLDMEFHIRKNQHVYATFNHAFRVPTYTELYYTDPANQGDHSLKPEKVRSLEFGYRFNSSRVSFQSAVFGRWSRNLIDWVWSPENGLWKARNITDVRARGLEMDFQWNISPDGSGFRPVYFQTSYAYLVSDKDTAGQLSKYVPNELKHQGLIQVRMDLGLHGLSQSISLRYEDRLNNGDHVLLDTRIRYHIQRLTLYTDIKNALNQAYREYMLIPMPGRKISIGLMFDILP